MGRGAKLLKTTGIKQRVSVFGVIQIIILIKITIMLHFCRSDDLLKCLKIETERIRIYCCGVKLTHRLDRVI